MSRPDVISPSHRLMDGLLPAVAIYWLVLAALSALIFLPGAEDWIGPDNDDVMRLVEIRDWLGGQGWFNLMQYRLGLSGGTLMHWSRLVDAPIAFLISSFSLVMSRTAAEAVSASLWPLLLAGFLLFPLGLVGRRLGGCRAMHIALGLGAIFVFTCVKFRPGALDHHNVQLVLVIWLAALLADQNGRARDHAVAGVAAALAIAVGAENVPLVATACLCVGARWIWQGRVFNTGARAFGLGLALAITAAFVATVPPQRYSVVTCDNLSFAFYALSAMGGAGLVALTLLPARLGLPARLVASAVLGTLLAASAWFIAPQCLASPLANLDPMLVDLWLNSVTEAQSLLDEIRRSPETVPAFYGVGLIAMMTCAVQAWRGDHRGFHLLFLVMLTAAWGVAAIQVRGAFFANLLSIPPFALLIADLQQKMRSNRTNARVALAFLAAGLAAVPAAWGVAGIVLIEGYKSLKFDAVAVTPQGEEATSCNRETDIAGLRALDAALVAAPSNSGASILRYTSHRVLAAPYHRNQDGMLTELRIGMVQPVEARSILRDAGVGIVAFCPTDPQTTSIMELKKDGLYAALASGNVPRYLQPVASASGALRLYRVVPD